jgi:REP element-mobilizing transposase RayT
VRILDFPRRKRNRLTGFNYSSKGSYFITICVKDRHNILGRLVGGGVLDAPRTSVLDAPRTSVLDAPRTSVLDAPRTSVLDAPRIELSEYGVIAEKYINSIDRAYKNISLDKYVIMPNHLHLILTVCNSGDGTPSPTNALVPLFVSTFKRFTNKNCRFSIFQRSYHDHIIRNEQEYQKIWQYIDANPRMWEEDCFYEC